MLWLRPVLILEEYEALPSQSLKYRPSPYTHISEKIDTDDNRVYIKRRINQEYGFDKILDFSIYDIIGPNALLHAELQLSLPQTFQGKYYAHLTGKKLLLRKSYLFIAGLLIPQSPD